MTRYHSIWFPLALALIMGVLTLWLNKATELDLAKQPLDPAKPQYLLEGIEAIQFGEAGRIKNRLQAASAWQLPQQTTIYFSKIQSQAEDAGQLHYTLHAQSAVYEPDTKALKLTDNVELTQPNGARLNMDSLNVDTQNQSAHTDAQVNYRQGPNTATATGLDYNHATGLLNLHSRIRAIYVPQ